MAKAKKPIKLKVIKRSGKATAAPAVAKKGGGRASRAQLLEALFATFQARQVSKRLLMPTAKLARGGDLKMNNSRNHQK